MTDRKELLMEGDRPKRNIDRDKLIRDLDEGRAIASMLEMRGWQIVHEKFIKPHMSDDLFYSADKADLADVRAAMRVLKELMSFIDSRIKAANDASEKINQ